MVKLTLPSHAWVHFIYIFWGQISWVIILYMEGPKQCFILQRAQGWLSEVFEANLRKGLMESGARFTVVSCFHEQAKVGARSMRRPRSQHSPVAV